MTVPKRKYPSVCKRKERFARAWSRVTSWDKWNGDPIFRVKRQVLHADSTDSEHLHQQRGTVSMTNPVLFHNCH